MPISAGNNVGPYRILRDGMFPQSRVLAIIRTVTEALAYAHAQGVWHRDIKPSNIVRANVGHIYLTDFGFARIAQAGDSTMSQDMFIGTPLQLADELARQKDYAAAFAEYDRAIRLAPKNSHAYTQAGESATTLGEFERADKYFTLGRNVAPDDLELLLGLCQT